MGGIITYTRQLLSTPPSLTPNGLYDALTLIIEELSSATSYTTEDHVQVGSFLSVLRASGLDHRAEYMVAAVKAVLNYSDLVENIESDGSGIIADIVGTGGDGQNTFNFSTSAAIIASGIPGIKICKHGGKASTSSSGAGDLINMLGCNSSKVTSESVAKLWENSFVFLLAPYFHRAMGAVAPIRKELGIPTIFNVLGPLMNPVAAVNKRVLGVYSENLAPEYIKAASLLYKESEIFVVWGHIGIDEVSPIGKTRVWHYIPNNATIDVFDIEPADFGLPEHDIKSCASLGSAKNAERLLSILRGESQRGDPIYDVILLNTALLYCLCNGTKDWAAGVEAVEASIKSSRALDSLNSFIASLETL